MLWAKEPQRWMVHCRLFVRRWSPAQGCHRFLITRCFQFKCLINCSGSLSPHTEGETGKTSSARGKTSAHLPLCEVSRRHFTQRQRRIAATRREVVGVTRVASHSWVHREDSLLRLFRDVFQFRCDAAFQVFQQCWENQIQTILRTTGGPRLMKTKGLIKSLSRLTTPHHRASA